MTEKAALTKGGLLAALEGASDEVPLLFNGKRVTGVALVRDGESGDLQARLLGEQDASVEVEPQTEPADPPPPAPGEEATDRLQDLQDRRKNDPGSLTEDEAKELAHLEHLAGVEERRAPAVAGDESAGEDDKADEAL